MRVKNIVCPICKRRLVKALSTDLLLYPKCCRDALKLAWQNKKLRNTRNINDTIK